MLGDHVQKWVGRGLATGAVLLGATFVILTTLSLLLRNEGTLDNCVESFARVTFLGTLICVVGWIVHAQRIQVGDIYQAGYDVGLQDGLRQAREEAEELAPNVVALPPRRSHPRRAMRH